MTSASSGNRTTAQDEYGVLRDEITQSKRYVLERPLVIVGVGVTLMTTQYSPEVAGALPTLMAGLLLFNFWFSVNRLISAARIVAYTKLVLEPNSNFVWIGWETSLQRYRLWTSKKDAGKRVDEVMKKKHPSDSNVFYAQIYSLHLILISVSASVAFSATGAADTSINLASSAIMIGILLVAGGYAMVWPPRRMERMLDRNEVIWVFALADEEPPVEGQD